MRKSPTFYSRESRLNCIFCAVLASIFAMLISSCTGYTESSAGFRSGGSITKGASISMGSKTAVFGWDGKEYVCEGDGTNYSCYMGKVDLGKDAQASFEFKNTGGRKLNVINIGSVESNLPVTVSNGCENGVDVESSCIITAKFNPNTVMQFKIVVPILLGGVTVNQGNTITKLLGFRRPATMEMEEKSDAFTPQIFTIEGWTEDNSGSTSGTTGGTSTGGTTTGTTGGTTTGTTGGTTTGTTGGTTTGTTGGTTTGTTGGTTTGTTGGTTTGTTGGTTTGTTGGTTTGTTGGTTTGTTGGTTTGTTGGTTTGTTGGTTTGTTGGTTGSTTSGINTSGLILSLDAQYAVNGAPADCSTTTSWQDLSGNNYNGELIGFSGCHIDSGWQGDGSLSSPYRLTLNGTSNGVRVSAGSNLSPPSLTVAGWVYNRGNGGQVFAKGNAQFSSSPYEYGLNLYSGYIALWARNIQTYWSTGGSYSGGDQQWKYVAFTWQEGGYTVSYNGNSVVSEADGSRFHSIPSTEDAFTIGYRVPGTQSGDLGSFFNGDIAMVQVYNRVLSYSELAENCRNTETRFSSQPICSGSNNNTIPTLTIAPADSRYQVGSTVPLIARYTDVGGNVTDVTDLATWTESFNLTGQVETYNIGQPRSFYVGDVPVYFTLKARYCATTDTCIEASTAMEVYSSYCGNGVIESGEQCDGSADCKSDCTLKSTTLSIESITGSSVTFVYLGDDQNYLNPNLECRTDSYSSFGQYASFWNSNPFSYGFSDGYYECRVFVGYYTNTVTFTITTYYCGNGMCEGGETQTSCPQDCGYGGPVCGNGSCEVGEDGFNCPGDCARCGNGQVEPGEQCDDWNNYPNDGCSSTCQSEQYCSYTGTYIDPSALCVPPAYCGNGVVESGEQCDGTPDCTSSCTLKSTTLSIQSQSGGSLAFTLSGDDAYSYFSFECRQDTYSSYNTYNTYWYSNPFYYNFSDGYYECRANFSGNYYSNTINFTVSTSYCGNGIVDSGEQCDGGANCSSSCTLLPPTLEIQSQTGSSVTFQLSGGYDSYYSVLECRPDSYSTFNYSTAAWYTSTLGQTFADGYYECRVYNNNTYTNAVAFTINTAYCGNGTCEAGETQIGCPMDCGYAEDLNPPCNSNGSCGVLEGTFYSGTNASSGIQYYDIATCPVETVMTYANVNVSSSSAFPGYHYSDSFGLRIRGRINITTDGYYTFALKADDYMSLYIDGNPLGFATYNSLTPTSQVYLSSGSHVIVMDFKNGASLVEMQLYWMPPGHSDFAIVPPSVFAAPQAGDLVPQFAYPDCSSVCGNGTCEAGEDSSSCPGDCGAVCGNGSCEAPVEDSANCPGDCGTACGNGTCDAGEDTANCPGDCTQQIGACNEAGDNSACNSNGSCTSGLQATFYTGTNPNKDIRVSDMSSCQQSGTGVYANVNVPNTYSYPGYQFDDSFGMVMRGRLIVNEAGSYYFGVRGDDGQAVYVDGTLVAYEATYNTLVTGDSSIYLTPGSHVIVILYKNATYAVGNEVFWLKPGDTCYSIIPSSNFASPEAGDNGLPSFTDTDCSSNGGNNTTNTNGSNPITGSVELEVSDGGGGIVFGDISNNQVSYSLFDANLTFGNKYSMSMPSIGGGMLLYPRQAAGSTYVLVQTNGMGGYPVYLVRIPNNDPGNPTMVTVAENADDTFRDIAVNSSGQIAVVYRLGGTAYLKIYDANLGIVVPDTQYCGGEGQYGVHVALNDNGNGVVSCQGHLNAPVILRLFSVSQIFTTAAFELPQPGLSGITWYDSHQVGMDNSGNMIVVRTTAGSQSIITFLNSDGSYGSEQVVAIGTGIDTYRMKNVYIKNVCGKYAVPVYGTETSTSMAVIGPSGMIASETAHLKTLHYDAFGNSYYLNGNTVMKNSAEAGLNQICN